MPRLTIRNQMIAVAVLALLMIDARFAILSLIMAGALTTLLPQNASRWPIPYLASLSCIYLPFSWIVLMDYPWNSYRWHWIKLWPIAPGLPAGLPFHASEFAENFVSGVVTLALVALTTKLGARGRKSLIVTNMIALILSGMVSFVAYQLFLF
ncbi:hypothetical protein P12x_001456 [Tundrisphaera lichenicola]|uniref:hypothetical protein n=1 Tax=Tundrisphaera lichenicola TaxID=2029860 RepID=UPI003EB93754